MRPTTFLPLLALSTVLATAACSSDTSSESEPAIAKSELTRNDAPTVPPGDLTALVDGDTAFATDLYKVLVKPGENLFFSPQSISTALAMTYAGARGTTASEMAKALHYTLPQEKLHNAFNGLDLALSSRGKNAKAADGAAFRLRVTNSLWGEPTMAFEKPFLDTLATNYGAGIRLTDFRGNPEGSRSTINGWVEKETETRIKDLLPSGSIDESTRLVLVNAVYFNGAWATPFEPSMTKPGTFHGLKGDAPVELMHQQIETLYGKGDGYEAVQVPYDGGELDLLAIVPSAETFESFESSLDAAKLKQITSSLGAKAVQLGLPKFKLDGATFSVKEKLESLGMKTAFTDAADFGGMVAPDKARLFVSDVLHQAFVAVDEKGTEAAAATAVVMNERASAAPEESVKLEIDRPFIFAVRDRQTGAIVFLGRIAKL